MYYPSPQNFSTDSRICVLKPKEPESSAWSHFFCGVELFLKQAGYANVDVVYIDKISCERQLQTVSHQYDLFFNMCDGTDMDGRAGFDVCFFLHSRCEVPFVGPSIKGYDPTREQMKKACFVSGIATPGHAFVYDTKADLHKLDHLKFPMIVKHFQSAGSWDLTRESKVNNKFDLENQLERMVGRNGGALVEEFIEGRQFTCLVADNCQDLNDPIVYDPVEYLFLVQGDTFKYESLKFNSSKQLDVVKTEDLSISNRIKELSKRFFKVLEIEAYARCDFRMNRDGQLFMLEINPVPGMFYPDAPSSADNIIINSPGGHTAFLNNLLQSALNRHHQRQKGWKIVDGEKGGYCCKAVKAFKEGDIVHDIGAQHMQVQLRNRFYLEVAPELVITSENELSNYKFFEASNDPNCWLDGLRITARRSIGASEILSFDYATLYGEDWRNLTKEGSQKYDWRKINEKYTGHVSKFVQVNE